MGVEPMDNERKYLDNTYCSLRNTKQKEYGRSKEPSACTQIVNNIDSAQERRNNQSRIVNEQYSR